MDVVELAKSMISYDTHAPPGSELGCARFIADQLKDLHIGGAEIEVHEFEKGRANLIARFDGDSPGLMLSGHMDVVPAPDVQNWTTPPFHADVRGGKLYGRGASDMKAGLAAMVAAARSLKGVRRKRGLVVIGTAGEEVDYQGLFAMIRDGKLKQVRAAYGITGEPTQMKVVRAHKGGVDLKVEFIGRSAHASDPSLGVNAIDNCVLFMNEFARFRRELSKTRDEDLGTTLLTPTVIHGGSKSNVIPGSCEVTIDGRLIPAHAPEAIVKRLRSILKDLSRRHKGFRAEIKVGLSDRGLLIPRESELVRMCEEVTGSSSTVARYGSEAVLYTEHGIPTVVLGPGSVEQAHIVDEFVTLKQLRSAESVYTRLIDRVCA